MSFRTTLILLLVLLVIGAVFFFDTKHVEKKEKAETEAKKVYPLEKTDIAKITLERSEGGTPTKVVMEKKDDKWVITEPIAAKADETAVDLIAETLTDTHRSKTVSSAAGLADYGLEQPLLKVTIAAKDDKSLPSLLVGDKTFTGYEVYAKKEGDPDVLVLEDVVKTRLDKPLSDFRDKKLMEFDSAKVKKFQIVHPEGTLTAERDENGSWYLNGDKKLRGDQKKIEDLLRAVRDARVSTFVEDAPKNLAAYGLAKPDRSFSLWLDDGMAEMTLELGAKIPAKELPKKKEAETPEGVPPDVNAGKETVYAKRHEMDNVVEIGASILTSVVPFIPRLRDSQVFKFEKDQITRLEVAATGSPTIVCAKDDKAVWKLMEPTVANANQGEITGLLTALSQANAAGYIDGQAENLAKFGLDQPQCRITVGDSEGKNQHTLLLGNRATDDKVTVQYAKNSDDATIYEVLPKDSDKLCKTYSQLRNRILMTFARRDLRKLEVAGNAGTATVESSNGTDFKGRLKGGRDLTMDEIDNLIWAFANIEAKEILTEDAKAQAADFGLAQPLVKVAAETKYKDPKTLAVGNYYPDKKGFVVQAGDDPLIGIQDENAFDKLLKMDFLVKTSVKLESKPAPEAVPESEGAAIE